MTHLNTAREAMRLADQLAAGPGEGDPQRTMRLIEGQLGLAKAAALVSIAESLVILAGRGRR